MVQARHTRCWKKRHANVEKKLFRRRNTTPALPVRGELPNLFSYLAAQLCDGTNIVDERVGSPVGPADAKH